MGRLHDNRFPGETASYRRARDDLLAAEIALRKSLEDVAAMRRKLPRGGIVREDYVFEEGVTETTNAVKNVRLSELFEDGKYSLIIYSFMYAPDAEQACPMCTSFLDSLDGAAPHVQDRVNLAVVAKAPIEKIRSWVQGRGWTNLRLFSSGKNAYNADYYAETPDGEQLPSVNVFSKSDEGIFHAYNTELFFVPPEEGQHPRHVDQLWPVWNLFDLTAEGRGQDWFPKVTYE